MNCILNVQRTVPYMFQHLALYSMHFKTIRKFIFGRFSNYAWGAYLSEAPDLTSFAEVPVFNLTCQFSNRLLCLCGCNLDMDQYEYSIHNNHHFQICNVYQKVAIVQRYQMGFCRHFNLSSNAFFQVWQNLQPSE